METFRMFPVDLTEVEENLGFEKVLVNNPDFEFYGHSSIVPAIIFRLGLGDRIIKISDPNGNVEYSHQIYGTYGSIGRPDWNPVLVPFSNPQVAIRAAQTGQDVADPHASKVRPASPSIPLRCPKCLKQFEVNVDHLPIDGLQECPECGTEDQHENFRDTNL